jgi:prevent-host-death family protein
MPKIARLIPISKLRNNSQEVFNHLKDEAIILTQRHKPAAVLVSVEEWH